jgi:hypothetical protein
MPQIKRNNFCIIAVDPHYTEVVADSLQHIRYKGSNHSHFRVHSYTLSVYLMLLYNEAWYNKEFIIVYLYTRI